MPIKCLTPKQEIHNEIEGWLARNEKMLLDAFSYVGERCVREARLNGAYQDISGNLRSSIGYVVLRNGQTYTQGGFKKVKGAKVGGLYGEELLTSLMHAHRKGLALIVVAGMNYAAYVETHKNVLASSEELAATLVPKMMKQLGFKLAA